jgi:TonB family protein
MVVQASQTPAPAGGQTPVRVGGNIPVPMKIKDVKPVYPAEAQASGAQGVVIIEATIDPEGKVANARVMRGVTAALDAAALDAVKQWEFTPTMVDGKAVPTIFTTTVNFSLGGGAAPPFTAPAMGFPSGPPPGRVSIYTLRTPDGKTNYWEIPQERAEALPDWNPRTSPPPLSIADAAKAAEAWLKKQNPEVKEFELASLSLARAFVYYGQRDRWYYNLYFDPIVSGKRLTGGGNFQVLVLFDGAVVEPRIELR